METWTIAGEELRRAKQSSQDFWKEKHNFPSLETLNVIRNIITNMSNLDSDDIDQDVPTPTVNPDGPAVDENSTQEHVTIEAAPLS